MKLIRDFTLLVVYMFGTNAGATLIDRGNGLIFDDVLDVTWVQDADLCNTLGNCISNNGDMTWDNAVAWADSLVFQGFDDWRLASGSVASGVPVGTANEADIVNCRNATEQQCRDNELAYMYYQNLGGFEDDLTGNQGPFINIRADYWSGTEVPGDSAYLLDFSEGQAGFIQKGFDGGAAWAVRSGDVRMLSEPSLGLLLAVGFAGLGYCRMFDSASQRLPALIR